MGYSNFTREGLYINAYRMIDEIDGFCSYNRDKIKQVFYNSAVLIVGFEERIIQDDDVEIGEFEDLFLRNMEQIHYDRMFVNSIRLSLQIQQEKKKVITYKDFFRFLLKSITEYQDEVIRDNFYSTIQYEVLKGKRTQTFLSYAYYDKGLSLALFYFFWNKLGFLYVDWMWEGINSNGTITKAVLEKKLAESDQLLFLRTTNSEMHIRGNHNSIRQWCSWEIGNYYTKHKTQKYFTSFYDKIPPTNDILDTFKPLKDVKQGVIIPF